MSELDDKASDRGNDSAEKPKLKEIPITHNDILIFVKDGDIGTKILYFLNTVWTRDSKKLFKSNIVFSLLLHPGFDLIFEKSEQVPDPLMPAKTQIISRFINIIAEMNNKGAIALEDRVFLESDPTEMYRQLARSQELDAPPEIAADEVYVDDAEALSIEAAEAEVTSSGVQKVSDGVMGKVTKALSRFVDFFRPTG